VSLQASQKMFVTNFSWCHPHHNTKLHECRTGLPRHLPRIEIKRIKCIMSDMQLFGLARTITLSKIRQRADKLPHCVATICFIHGIYRSHFKKWRGSFCNKSCVRKVPPCINDSKKSYQEGCVSHQWIYILERVKYACHITNNLSTGAQLSGIMFVLV